MEKVGWILTFALALTLALLLGMPSLAQGPDSIAAEGFNGPQGIGWLALVASLVLTVAGLGLRRAGRVRSDVDR